MINWTVRLRNPAFLATFIPQLGTVVGSIAYLFTIDWADPMAVQEAITACLFALLGAIGMAGSTNDPTVEGMSDSTRALSRQEPAPNALAELAAPVPEDERVELEEVKRKLDSNHADHWTGGDDDGQ